MRELSQTLKLQNGLKPDQRVPRNNEFLSECFNLKATNFGIGAYEPVNIPFTTDQIEFNELKLDWPHPQLFFGKGETILAKRDCLFWVDRETWELEPITTYDYNSPTATKSIVPGGPWQFVDFYGTWFMHNGMCSVMHTDRDRILNQTDRVYVQDGIRISAGTAWRGRAILGGFQKDKAFNQEWTSFIQDWAGRTKPDPNINLDLIFPENMVWWSSIGGGDTEWLFNKALGQDGLFTNDMWSSTQPEIFDRMQEGTLGWMPMPWQGQILDIKPMGKTCVVYGENGIAALSLAGPTLGLVEMEEFGIHNIGAVGGTEKGHVFLDQEGTLWSVNANLQVEELGYKEHFSQMVGSHVLISHVQRSRGVGEYHISNGFDTFLLTSKGLSKVGQPVTTKFFTQGGVVGMACESDINTTYATFKTEVLDFDLTSIKQIRWVELRGDFQDFTTLEMKIEYKFKPNDDWSNTGWLQCNTQGARWFGTAGREFRIAVRNSDFTCFKPDELIIRYTNTERLRTRGI